METQHELTEAEADSARLDWIIENATSVGGGHGSTYTFFVPYDSECNRLRARPSASPPERKLAAQRASLADYLYAGSVKVADAQSERAGEPSNAPEDVRLNMK